MKKAISTIQIVDVSGETPKHVKKLSCTLTGENVLHHVQKFLKGHLVNEKIDEEMPQIGEENDVQEESRGKEEKSKKGHK